MTAGLPGPLRRLALAAAAALAGACGSSPVTVTAAPRGWPVPLVGRPGALLGLGGALLLVEHAPVEGPGALTRLSRVPADGGLPALVGLGRGPWLRAPVVSGDEVLWVSGQPAQLRLAPARGGGPSRLLVTEPGWIEGLAADATHVYFGRTRRLPAAGGGAERWERSVVRVARAGGPAEPVAAALCAASCAGPLAVVGGTLYVATEDAVEALSLVDGSRVVLASGLRPRRARVDGDDVFVLSRPSADGVADAALRVVPRAGGPARTLVAGLADPVTTGGTFGDFALAPSHVVLLDRFHQPRAELVVVRRADGHVERRALGRGELPERVAIDGGWIYLAVGGVVRRERLEP